MIKLFKRADGSIDREAPYVFDSNVFQGSTGTLGIDDGYKALCGFGLPETSWVCADFPAGILDDETGAPGYFRRYCAELYLDFAREPSPDNTGLTPGTAFAGFAELAASMFFTCTAFRRACHLGVLVHCTETVTDTLPAGNTNWTGFMFDGLHFTKHTASGGSLTSATIRNGVINNSVRLDLPWVDLLSCTVNSTARCAFRHVYNSAVTANVPPGGGTSDLDITVTDIFASTVAMTGASRCPNSTYRSVFFTADAASASTITLAPGTRITDEAIGGLTGHPAGADISIRVLTRGSTATVNAVQDIEYNDANALDARFSSGGTFTDVYNSAINLNFLVSSGSRAEEEYIADRGTIYFGTGGRPSVGKLIGSTFAMLWNGSPQIQNGRDAYYAEYGAGSAWFRAGQGSSYFAGMKAPFIRIAENSSITIKPPPGGVKAGDGGNGNADAPSNTSAYSGGTGGTAERGSSCLCGSPMHGGDSGVPVRGCGSHDGLFGYGSFGFRLWAGAVKVAEVAHGADGVFKCADGTVKTCAEYHSDDPDTYCASGELEDIIIGDSWTNVNFNFINS